MTAHAGNGDIARCQTTCARAVIAVAHGNWTRTLSATRGFYSAISSCTCGDSQLAGQTSHVVLITCSCNGTAKCAPLHAGRICAERRSLHWICQHGSLQCTQCLPTTPRLRLDTAQFSGKKPGLVEGLRPWTAMWISECTRGRLSSAVRGGQVPAALEEAR